MADVLRQDGKIYSVVFGLVVILTAMIFLLIRLDRKTFSRRTRSQSRKAGITSLTFPSGAEQMKNAYHCSAKHLTRFFNSAPSGRRPRNYLRRALSLTCALGYSHYPGDERTASSNIPANIPFAFHVKHYLNYCIIVFKRT